MERKRVIETIIGIIFLTFLLFVMLVIIQFSHQENAIKETPFENNQIIIKYNYYDVTYVSGDIIQNSKILKDNIVIMKTNPTIIHNKYHEYQSIKKYTADTSLKVEKASKYHSYSSHERTSSLGLYTDTFVVNINNLAGGQRYTVIWTFEDYWGAKRIYEDTKYIFGNDSKKFFFKDISKDSTYYHSWSYQVIPILE